MKDLRRDYASRALTDDAAAADPMVQFKGWFADALAANLIDANAMSVATASPSGEPSVRTVLLKDVDERGFMFFTHYTSPKGRDLTENPRASLLFFWPALQPAGVRRVPVGEIVYASPRNLLRLSVALLEVFETREQRVGVMSASGEFQDAARRAQAHGRMLLRAQ
ncbi:MAG TPA: pyridoxamine 5'-phosphate oxidase family protein [Vicinamibacterales bacterium]|nr:pyridoxamine 5'-phosphate oxidase family protein [Vicinamibacterales bacterium]